MLAQTHVEETKNIKKLLLYFIAPISLSLAFIIFHNDTDLNTLFNTSTAMKYTIMMRVPFLMISLWKIIKLIVAISIAVFLFYKIHSQYKKLFVFILANIAVCARLNYIDALTILVASYLIWLVLEKASKHLRIILISLLFLVLYVTFTLHPSYLSFEWRFFAQMIAGVIASVYVKNKHEKKLNFYDCFILWCGIPGAILIIFGHNEFNSSFLNNKYSLILKEGISRIYSGLSKIIPVATIQYLLYPYWSITRSNVSDINLWGGELTLIGNLLWALLIYFTFLLLHVGTLQVVFGIAGLFGYNLKEQTNRPWLSKSFLDFWKRIARHNREYLLKHIFNPCYRYTQSLYLSILLVWFFWALLSGISMGLLNNSLGPFYTTSSEIFYSVIIKYGLIFAHVTYIELRLARIKSKLSKITQRFVSIILFLLFISLMLIAQEVIPGPFSQYLYNWKLV